MCNESVLERDWEPHKSLRTTETQVAEAKGTEKKINEVGELYRPSAEGASLLFFIISDLCKLTPIYQCPLEAGLAVI